MDEQDHHIEPNQVEASVPSKPFELLTGNNSPEPQPDNSTKKINYPFDTEKYLRNPIAGSSKIQLAAILFLVSGVVTNLLTYRLSQSLFCYIS